MASKRTFKKAVDMVGADLCENMMIALVNVEGADKNAISQAVGKVLEAVETSRSNSNVHFDRGVKAFGSLKEYSVEKKKFYAALFNKVIKDFDTTIGEALKLFNGALPEEVKKLQKESVN